MQIFQDLMPSLRLGRWTPSVLRKHLLNEETESIESLCHLMMESDGEYTSLLLAERILIAYEGLTEPELLDAMHVGLVVGGSIVIPHMRRAIATLDELDEQDQ